MRNSEIRCFMASSGGDKSALRAFHTVCFYGSKDYYEMVRKAFTDRKIIQLTLPDMLSLLDPYLLNALENLRRAHKVIADDLSDAVLHTFNAVMDMLQRRIIDEKGVKVLEDLRKQKRIHLDILLKILKDVDVEISRDLESQLHMLRELRNKVVHERYKATKDETMWALRLVEGLASSWYPIVLNRLDHETETRK